MKLFPYQVDGIAWLVERKLALLADEMGLGKTVQAIVAADSVGAKQLCVVCPAVARPNWLRELQRFSVHTDRKYYVANTATQLPPPESSIIMSYDVATRYHEQGVFKNHRFDVLILDESHFLKSIDAKRTAAIMGTEGLVRHAKRVWMLTGTPMPNHPGELWIMLYSFGLTKLQFIPFLTRYCNFAPGYGPYSGKMQIVGAKKERIPELRALLKPAMLRRTKEKVMQQLPPMILNDVIVLRGKVDLREHSSFFQYVTPKDRRAELKAILKKQADNLKLVAEMTLDPGNKQDVDMMRGTERTMMMLEAIAPSISTLRRYLGLQKIEPISQMVDEELSTGAYSKIVIFCIHKDVIEGLRKRLAKYGAVTLYGGTSPRHRQRNIDRFQSNPKCRVFIGNILAAGTAINLTASDQVLLVEPDFVPSNNAQAIARCHRIGQTRTVNVRFVGILNSLDEKINGILRRKTRDIIAIFDPAFQEKC